MAQAETPFRVIVVGGGVAGLAASHALQKAGIDHVVLERRSSVAPPEGASIAMYPNGARILHQFGALEAVQKHCVPPGRYWARLPNKKIISNNGVFRIIEQNHGSGLLLIERRQFLQELYDTLPNNSYIRTDAGVRDIKMTPGGVEVELNNGDVEKGDLVLGCDGVYSRVRTIMWDYANKMTPGLIPVEEKLAIKADWKSLIVMTTAIPELGAKDLTIVHNDNYSHMFTMTPKFGYFFVFFRLSEPCTWPHRPRYTDQDAEDLAAKIASHPVSDTMVFGEVWKHRIRANVVNLEEGVLDHWYHGRIALAGDSAHKVTPNMAFGGNSGIESVAVFTNHLRRLLAESKGAKPSAAKLEAALADYQQERRARMLEICNFSGEVTRAQAWASPWYKFLARWVIPMLPASAFGNQLGAIISAAPKLDFVDVGQFPAGRMPWKDSVAPHRHTGDNKSGVGLGISGYGYLSAFAACALVLYMSRLLPLAINT
ncbi:hypothetical protein KVR01_005734 [Diaporthe batatas]|uniref:uncharacterized protein n=1 Tax=Diaporthe batatas TaxID=748121 RepID=UPI001D05B01F|nr:uncharacterized protein KVR01_005734 [Diaporthe batatas]KAG8163816.1 hypothetical protein KVR01_005734 [Diaporthe batatas]